MFINVGDAGQKHRHARFKPWWRSSSTTSSRAGSGRAYRVVFGIAARGADRRDGPCDTFDEPRSRKKRPPSPPRRLHPGRPSRPARSARGSVAPRFLVRRRCPGNANHPPRSRILRPVEYRVGRPLAKAAASPPVHEHSVPAEENHVQRAVLGTGCGDRPSGEGGVVRGRERLGPSAFRGVPTTAVATCAFLASPACLSAARRRASMESPKRRVRGRARAGAPRPLASTCVRTAGCRAVSSPCQRSPSR